MAGILEQTGIRPVPVTELRTICPPIAIEPKPGEKAPAASTYLGQERAINAIRFGIGMKLAVVGPMRLLDMAGLDIYQSVASFLNAELCNRADVSPMVTEATDSGRLGMKTAGGLFPYDADELKRLPAERAKALVAVRRALEADSS